MKIPYHWPGTLELPPHPQRIVSLAPSITDSLFALGVGPKLVGRSAFCYRPLEALELARVSSYTKVRLDLLKAIKPDLVLISAGMQRDLLGQLDDQGLSVFAIPLPHSPYGILENLVLLGALLAAGERASMLCAELADRYARLHQILPPMKYYLEFDQGGPITIGRGSHVSEALRHLGLINIYADHPQSFFAPDLAYVEQQSPSFVIYEPKPQGSGQLKRVGELFASRGWGYPWVLTPGDQLAHYGPQFFAYLETIERQIEHLEI